MIQIYSPGNTTFTQNGDMVLMPSSCIHTAVLKGSWEIELDHPKDDEGRWKYIVEGAVLSVPTFMGDKQLFRLYEVEKGDTEIQAYGRPIFFDSANNVFLLDRRPTNLNGQQALTYIMDGTGYTGESDIVKVSTAYYVRKNLIEAINGSDDDAFINRWGGEPLYRNYHIIINETAGDDNNVQVRYGKNISSITETINMDDVITRIVPISYNGHMLAGNSPWVDSSLINSYPIVYTKLVKFENIKLRSDLQGDPSDSDIICDTLAELWAALEDAADAMFADGCDKPYVTMDVDMVDLAQTDEYKDYSVLETVRLGDTVHCIHRDLGIDTKSRVTEIKWDCIHNCIDNVLIGQPKTDYFSNLQSTVSATAGILDGDGNIIAERVRGVLNAQRVHLAYQLTVAERSDVRAILFEDLDTTSPTYGALAIGTQGIEISRQRNAYDTDWVWTTAIDFQTIHAENIIAGLLSDALGNNYWNLSTGEFSLSSGTIIDGTSGDTIGGMKTAISANSSGLSAEVTARTDADTNLSSRITANATAITTKVTAGDVESIIQQDADSIRLKATTLVWTATNSSLSADGTLSATNGSFTGTVSGSTISGGTVTGSAISGGTINGSTITGATISGGTITGGELTSTNGTGIITIEDGAMTVSSRNYGDIGTIEYLIWTPNNQPTMQINGDVIAIGGTDNQSTKVMVVDYSSIIDGQNQLFIYGPTRINGELTLGNGGSLTGVLYSGGNKAVVLNDCVIVGSSALMSGFIMRVSGSLYVDGSVVDSSDERKKDILEWGDNVDAFIMDLDPIRYRWKDDRDQKDHYGLGAQRTLATLEEHGLDGCALVRYTEESDDYGVTYSEFAPMMLPSLQQNRKRIEELENEVDSLKKEVAELKALINTYIGSDSIK